MKRLEVEFEKVGYWIITFETIIRKDVFSYEGEVPISSVITSDKRNIPFEVTGLQKDAVTHFT